MSQSVIKLYQDYYSRPEIVRADVRWEKGEEDTMFLMKGGGKEYLAGTVEGKPLYEEGVMSDPPLKTWRRNGGRMVAKSRNWCAVITGGSCEENTPHNIDPISFDIGGYSSMMGLIHVIVIPNRRISNSVSIMADDIPLMGEGIQLLDTAFDILIKGGSDEIGSVRWHLSRSGAMTMNDGTEKVVKVTEDDFIDSCKENFRDLLTDTQRMLDTMKMEVTVNVGAMADIRKLHLHGISSGYRTIASQEIDKKSIVDFGCIKHYPLDEVIYMAKSGRSKEMRDTIL